MSIGDSDNGKQMFCFDFFPHLVTNLFIWQFVSRLKVHLMSVSRLIKLMSSKTSKTDS